MFLMNASTIVLGKLQIIIFFLICFCLEESLVKQVDVNYVMLLSFIMCKRLILK